MNLREAGLLAAMSLACVGLWHDQALGATRYHARLLTSPDQWARLGFDFTCNDSAANTVALLNFGHDGTRAQLVLSGGPITGDILSGSNPADTSTIEGAAFFNEVLLQIAPLGNQIDFDVDLTENAPGVVRPEDEFAFFYLAGEDTVPYPTSDPSGANAMFAIDVTGASGGELTVFFVRRGWLEEEAAAGMMSWPQSGFGAYLGPRIEEREGLLRVARYAARAAVVEGQLRQDAARVEVGLVSERVDGPYARVRSTGGFTPGTQLRLPMPDAGLDNHMMNVIHRLPRWLQGCLAGNALGGLLFVVCVALFSLTPLYLLVAVFAAWGSSGGEIFRALALPAALVGAWVGGLVGMPIGALVGRADPRAAQRWSLPGWLTGAIVTAYVFLPGFLDPSTKIASKPVATRVLTFVILTALGALVGYASGAIRRLVRKRT